jgi:hypothetical protein
VCSICEAFNHPSTARHERQEGWLDVAAVIDLFSRPVVGWSMSASMTAQLVTDALVMAIWRRGKPVRCCITLIAAASTQSSSSSRRRLGRGPVVFHCSPPAPAQADLALGPAGAARSCPVKSIARAINAIRIIRICSQVAPRLIVGAEIWTLLLGRRLRPRKIRTGWIALLLRYGSRNGGENKKTGRQRLHGDGPLRESTHHR